MRKDKCWILQSYLGAYTLPWQENGMKYYTYLSGDGSLDREAVNRMAFDVAYYGANATREFPLWPNENLTINEYWCKGKSHFKEKFFQDWREIVRIYNSYGITVFIELFDFCGTRNFRRKHQLFGLWNPWNVPFPDIVNGTSETIQGNFFWGPESLPSRTAYIRQFIEAMRGLDVAWGVCNEPRIERVTVKMMGTFLADTFQQLIVSGIPPERILLPVELNLKESHDPDHKKYGKLYMEFRKQIVKRLPEGKKWEQWLKDRCITPVHGATLKSVSKILENAPVWGGGSRNIIWSSDGVRDPSRPVKEMIAGWVSTVFQKKEKATREGKMHFEVLRKQGGDPADSALGIAEVYNEFFGEKPYNLYRIFEPFRLEPEPERPELERPEPERPEPEQEKAMKNKKWMTAGMITVALIVGISALWYPYIAWGIGAMLIFSVSFLAKEWKWRWWYVANVIGFAGGLFLLAALKEPLAIAGIATGYHIIILVKNFGFKLR